jgi:hypothetical protein
LIYIPNVPIDIKEEVVAEDMFDNLATLAEVSLATAGQLTENKTLKRQIDQARAKIDTKRTKMSAKNTTILPVTPAMSSKRTMQVNKNHKKLTSECQSELSLTSILCGYTIKSTYLHQLKS